MTCDCVGTEDLGRVEGCVGGRKISGGWKGDLGRVEGRPREGGREIVREGERWPGEDPDRSGTSWGLSLRVRSGK